MLSKTFINKGFVRVVVVCECVVLVEMCVNYDCKHKDNISNKYIQIRLAWLGFVR